MRRWDLKIVLDPNRELPLFLQLASAIAEAIRNGRLVPGDPLPGSRLLAEQLSVNRNTVIAGYDELTAEGLVRTRPGGGTFVAELTGTVPPHCEHLIQEALAPGIGTGFVVAPPPVFDRLVSLRAASDARSDAAMECAIAELFEDGELLRHLRRIRRIYTSRRDALVDSLTQHLRNAVEFRVPEGGMALWLRADDSIDVADWIRASEQEGVSFDGGQRYDVLNREQPYLRLGFTPYDEAQLKEAVARMARALGGTRRQRPSRAAYGAWREDSRHVGAKS